MSLSSSALIRRGSQWVMDTLSPVARKEVKEKSLKALESLGHKDLELDEYEGAPVLLCQSARVLRLPSSNCLRGYPPGRHQC